MKAQQGTSPARKLALVTGAGGSLGAAIARALLEAGHRVVVADSNADALAGVVRSLGADALPLVFDLGREVEIEAACRRIAEWGEVDILVNNAGILSNDKLLDTTLEQWRRIHAVNLDAAYLLCRSFVPGMRQRGFGRIVNVCSVAMKTGGLTAGTAYTTSKGALAALTFSLARELAPHGVTANGIAPAYVRSKMITEQLDEEQRRRVLEGIPVRRFCEPEEVAHAVLFLSSPLAGFITGEIIDINGGLHLD